MATEYNPITAAHYAAYRPSLHLPILEKCFGEKEYFELGLDVGCGTGQSAMALANFCRKVIAIDPSEAMLKNAIQQEKITYEHCNGQDLEFAPNSFDIITFAGVLYYAKSQHLLNEVIKVAKSKSKVIVYDFAMLLDETLKQLGLTPPTKIELTYDHETNFSGLELQHMQLANKCKEQVPFEINTTNLAHLLMADNDHYALLSAKFGETDLYEKLMDQLLHSAGKDVHQITALLYHSTYILTLSP